MSGRSASSANRTSSASIASSTAEGVVTAAVVGDSSASLLPGWEVVGVDLGCSLKREEGTPSGKLPVGCRNRGPSAAELGRVRLRLRSRPGDTNLSGETLPAWGSKGYHAACEATRGPPRFNSMMALPSWSLLWVSTLWFLTVYLNLPQWGRRWEIHSNSHSSPVQQYELTRSSTIAAAEQTDDIRGTVGFLAGFQRVP